MWIDTHAHLNSEPLWSDPAAALAAAKAAGVEAVVVVGYDLESSRRAVRLAADHPDEVFAVPGIQPNHLAEMAEGDWDAMVALLDNPGVVGLGETGLDRYWDRAPFDLQIDYFHRHLTLANERGLPVVVHCRDAEADIARVLADHAGPLPQGVMHSYCGDLAHAERFVGFGLHLSFSGMVTFKANAALRELSAWCPADRLLVETDAPYLTPVPHRGRRNQPAYVTHVGAAVAAARGVPVAELARTTTDNARRLFRIGK